MCGRFTIAVTIGLYERFLVINRSYDILPRWNVAPAEEVPVVTGARDGEDARDLVMMQWGLVPAWARLPAFRPLINARAESLAEKPIFQNLLRTRRCLVPATGFYDWQHAGTKRVPWYIRKKDCSLFAFAGLYDTRPDDNTRATFTIITTAPNALVEPLHNRMPVIVSPDREREWLAGVHIDPAGVREYFLPYPAEELEAYRVSSRVNTPRAEGPDLIRPLSSGLPLT
jgi:putative SOS response-associated peptidase YedK